ncbi:MAG: GNAT family N-acetyltransferase [Chloroflexi bacterium]|nr:GNAT family N-acetyltransferase [Chloroflexota bacterium]
MRRAKMPAMDVCVRRITAADGPLLRELRLRSLSEAPEAFGQSLADAAARPDAEWRAEAKAASQGDRRAWFIAHDAGADRTTSVGVVLVRRRPPDVALVFSMWVDPQVRRGGVGRVLIRAATDWAASWGADRVVLWVVAGNEPAIRFYQRLGFTLVDSGPDAESGRAYGALAMVRGITAEAFRAP